MKNTVWFCFLLLFLGCSSIKQTNSSIEKETKNKALKILIISDLNANYGDTTYSVDVANVIGEIAKIKPDLILCGGDMVAGQKATLTTKQLNSMWTNFNRTVLQPINKLQIPFGFTVGNHDASPTFTNERAVTKQFWDNQLKTSRLSFVDSTNYPFYFSYVKNNVFIISWDAAGGNIKPEVFSWVKEQLKSAIAKNASVRILLGHLPLYAIVASKNKPGEVIANADSTLQFFKDNGVDLYISGHQHAYFPAHKNGVQLLNLGAIGNGPRPILGHTDTAKKAYTILEIPVNNAQKFSYKTFMPSTNVEIKLNSLPDSVIGFNGIIKRRAIEN